MSEGMKRSERWRILLDRARGEYFECSFGSIHANNPRALEGGAIIMMFVVLRLYKDGYDIGYLS